MKGGAEIIEENKRNDETRIACINTNGFPSNKANGHKMKILNDIAETNYPMIILEMGINRDAKPKNISDQLEVTKINLMEEVKNE